MNETKFGGTPEKQKENLVPSQQWDHLAFEIVSQTLAPKGFKKITNGAHRGATIARLDHGLERHQVQKLQRSVAQLVRSFRSKTKKSLQERLQKVEERSKSASDLFNNCKFWEFKKKGLLQKEYFHYRDQCGLLMILINELDNIEIK
jgi:hypothetical protein